MIRVVSGLAIALVLLAGCGDRQSKESVETTGARMAAMEAPSPPPPPAGGADQATITPKLAYSHRMALEMAAERVAARYERARASCLSDRTMGCTLVQASIRAGDARSQTLPYANLTVRLPHDKVAVFEAALLAPFAGESKGEPIVRERATDAEDLTYALLDVETRLAQLTDYRTRLIALAKRGDAKVDDLIKIEEKISQVQSEIEQLQAAQRGLNLRVDTEVLSVSLSAIASLEDVRSPLAEAWRRAGQVLGESAARAFTFLVTAVPWVPLIALGLWLLVRLWRMVRSRRRHAHHEGAAH
jgi:hypothetical protein